MIRLPANEHINHRLYEHIMPKKAQYKLPIETAYLYDARSTLSSRKADFTTHCLTPHGAKRAAYKHLDKDFGDARKAIITDLRTGLELWHMTLLRETGTISIQAISPKTQLAVDADIRVMKREGKRF